MADLMKVLGQSTPGTTLTDMYTCPTNTQTVVSTLVACNISGSGVTFRVAVRPRGQAIANKHYLYYDKSIGANDSVAMTWGITINEGDIVSVYGSDSNVQFTMFGVETT